MPQAQIPPPSSFCLQSLPSSSASAGYFSKTYITLQLFAFLSSSVARSLRQYRIQASQMVMTFYNQSPYSSVPHWSPGAPCTAPNSRAGRPGPSGRPQLLPVCSLLTDTTATTTPVTMSPAIFQLSHHKSKIGHDPPPSGSLCQVQTLSFAMDISFYLAPPLDLRRESPPMNASHGRHTE